MHTYHILISKVLRLPIIPTNQMQLVVVMQVHNLQHIPSHRNQQLLLHRIQQLIHLLIHRHQQGYTRNSNWYIDIFFIQNKLKTKWISIPWRHWYVYIWVFLFKINLFASMNFLLFVVVSFHSNVQHQIWLDEFQRLINMWEILLWTRLRRLITWK